MSSAHTTKRGECLRLQMMCFEPFDELELGVLDGELGLVFEGYQR